jgi:hypothetical protein
LELSRNAARGGDAATRSSPGRQPEPEEVNASKADNPEKPVVIIPANEFSLPKVLRHLEAGKIVLVIPAPDTSE